MKLIDKLTTELSMSNTYYSYDGVLTESQAQKIQEEHEKHPAGYGFFNYIDWVRHNEKEMVLSEDYIPRKKISWIEKIWLNTKENNLTTDSIMMIIKKR